MDINDKILIEATKTTKDTQLSKGIVNLVDEKLSTFTASGIEGLLSNELSRFVTDIKKLIGKFILNITNSIDIIAENSQNFFDKVTEGFEKVPEDLKDTNSETTEPDVENEQNNPTDAELAEAASNNSSVRGRFG
jgi:hypothetical protein